MTVMKDQLKQFSILAALLLTLFRETEGQQLSTYNLQHLPQRSYMNPSFAPHGKINIGIPVLSGVSHSYTNNGFTYSDLFKRTENNILILDISSALEELKYLHYEPVGDFAKVDHHRTLRTGFPEVIFGIGKTPEQIVQIMGVMESKSPVVMATKISAAVYEQIRPSLSSLRYFPIAQICCLGESIMQKQGTITIITAGTADLPIAEEAAVI